MSTHITSIGHHPSGMPIWPEGAMKTLGEEGAKRILRAWQKDADPDELV